MKLDHYNQLIDLDNHGKPTKWERRAIGFICYVKMEGLPLEWININDWPNNLRPAVYVSTPHGHKLGHKIYTFRQCSKKQANKILTLLK